MHEKEDEMPTIEGSNCPLLFAEVLKAARGWALVLI
jgi:hypothetical protein